MGEQGSILIQKKLILVLSVIILTLVMSLTFAKSERKIEVADQEDRASNLIFVNSEEIENNVILIEQDSYAAFQKIEEQEAENNESETVINEEKKENEKEIVSENKNYVSYKTLAEDNPPLEYNNVIEATATAYCLCEKCCGKSPSNPGYGVTASGYRIVPGNGDKVIAVDPSVISLGSKVYVEGLNGAWDYGHAIAADTGGAIKNIRVDLYMDSHQDTLNWGVKKVKVYVLSEGN